VTDIKQTKQAQRQQAKRHREKIDHGGAADLAARQFLENIPFRSSDIVSLYYPVGCELDPLPLLNKLIERDIETALPFVSRKDHPLEFRLWADGDDLETGAYGIPAPAKQAKCVIPDIVVIPMLAFDQYGARMGYGGGFYDRTLEKLRSSGQVLAVGYAYGGQQVDKVITDPLDQPMDWIVTEQTARKIQ